MGSEWRGGGGHNVRGEGGGEEGRGGGGAVFSPVLTVPTLLFVLKKGEELGV